MAMPHAAFAKKALELLKTFKAIKKFAFVANVAKSFRNSLNGKEAI